MRSKKRMVSCAPINLSKCSGEFAAYLNTSEMMKPSDAATIIKVAIQPPTRGRLEIADLPMIDRFVAICIKRTMICTATMALSTADQTSAFIGLIFNMFATAPTNVAAAIVP